MIKIEGLKELNGWLGGLDGRVKTSALIEVTYDVFENVKSLAKVHRDTGVMEENIEKDVTLNIGKVGISDRNMLVDWNGKKINYATFVLFGSKPHKIEAKNKKSLMWAGLNGFAKSVNHQGYEGDNFLQKGAEQTFKNLDNIYKGVLDGIR